MKNPKLSRIDDSTLIQNQAPYANYEPRQDGLEDVFLLDMDTLNKELSKTDVTPEEVINKFVSSKTGEQASKLLETVNVMLAKEVKKTMTEETAPEEADQPKEEEYETHENALTEEEMREFYGEDSVKDTSEESGDTEELPGEGEESSGEEDTEEPAPMEEVEPEKETQNYNIGRLLIMFEDANIKTDIQHALEEAGISDSAYNYSPPSFSMKKGDHRFHRFLINSLNIEVESRENLEDKFDDLLAELGSYYREDYVKLKSDGPFSEEMDQIIKKIK